MNDLYMANMPNTLRSFCGPHDQLMVQPALQINFGPNPSHRSVHHGFHVPLLAVLFSGCAFNSASLKSDVSVSDTCGHAQGGGQSSGYSVQ